MRKLFSQTAIYGLSNIVGRFLNFLLVPLYTAVLFPEDFAVLTVFYAAAAFINVLLSFGMETAYFNFCRQEDHQKVFNHTFSWILILSGVFVAIGIPFPGMISLPLGYPEHHVFARWLILILSADALSVIPFARLRQENKAIQFGAIKLAGIAVNIGLNLFFLLLCPYLVKQGYPLGWYDETFGVGYIFIANLSASLIGFLLLIPQYRGYKWALGGPLMSSLLSYALPLVVVGFAGMINEVLDRILLKHMLPAESADFETGVYGAFYRLSIIITIFIQAFRFAAEPFFFEKSKDPDARPTYAKVMNYFVGVCSFIFLATMLYLSELAPVFIRKSEYFDHEWGILVVPLLLLANVFLGIYYNLSIWYKLQNKNKLGAVVALGGAALTLLLNTLLIPILGIMGSAATTLIVYFFMALSSYFLGQHYYRVPYQIANILAYLILAIALYAVFSFVPQHLIPIPGYALRPLLLLLFAFLFVMIERPQKKY